MDVPPLLGGALDGSAFVIAEWVDDNESSAAQPVAPLHVHHGDDEAWYVLEGALGFIRGDERLEAQAGAGVLVPRGSGHTFWNAAGARTRYLIVMTPKIARLIEALHEPGAFDDLHSLFHRFDSELLV
jgi:mannose-6-phosphate isomerase-like protein (cupin superfamily)